MQLNPKQYKLIYHSILQLFIRQYHHFSNLLLLTQQIIFNQTIKKISANLNILMNYTNHTLLHIHLLIIQFLQFPKTLFLQSWLLLQLNYSDNQQQKQEKNQKNQKFSMCQQDLHQCNMFVYVQSYYQYIQ
ncbi:unnamed protein product [Paramecium sonneborni]|uniref:Uncharacterized protein n=1 Tax=Paramecium sonneborni TaxID=65129 RepID=A0A8S1RDP8_9CILI|nr:unnamed protein product [Paramecium sonneborni]